MCMQMIKVYLTDPLREPGHILKIIFSKLVQMMIFRIFMNFDTRKCFLIQFNPLVARIIAT